MRRSVPFLIFFMCVAAACITTPVQQAPVTVTPQADSGQDFFVPVYSGTYVQKISYNQIAAHAYQEIPDRVSPVLAPVIANSSFSGNVSNVARIALQDPCIRKILHDGGFVLGVDYYIPFHGEPSPRFITYAPGGVAERRISAFVDETDGRVNSLMIEYRYNASSQRPDFDPFTADGWAGGYTCARDRCNEVC